MNKQTNKTVPKVQRERSPSWSCPQQRWATAACRAPKAHSGCLAPGHRTGCSCLKCPLLPMQLSNGIVTAKARCSYYSGGVGHKGSSIPAGKALVDGVLPSPSCPQNQEKLQPCRILSELHPFVAWSLALYFPSPHSPAWKAKESK